MNKLDELNKIPLITDVEYDHWMSTAVKGQPIPESIHRYFREVLCPRHEENWEKLRKSSGYII
jgi:hypothetical protein